MGTRARIGLELQDGSVLSVYHHYDGYPKWLGRILTTHYNTKESVSDLIDGGDMSSAWTNCGWNNETRPETGPMYYTSRGESIENNAPELSKDHGEYLKMSADSDEEYSYLFADGEWICYNTRSWDDAFMEKVEIPAGSINDKN